MQVLSIQAADPRQHIQMAYPQQFVLSKADLINPGRLGFSQKALDLINYIDTGNIEDEPLDKPLLKQIKQIHAELKKEDNQKDQYFAKVIAFRISRQNPKRYNPLSLKLTYEAWARNQLEKRLKKLPMHPPIE